MKKSLKFVPYENHSGFEPDNWPSHVPILPKRHMQILDEAIAGEAPKDFIKVYEFGRTARKSNPKTWPKYIAKFAKKWYPNESITEHLLNRLGYILGVRVANSRLVRDEEFGRLRFLSEYFLRSSERLEHGAEIFAGYLSDDKLVEELEKDRRGVRNFFTFQFAEKAIQHRFGHGDEGKNLIRDFVRMLCFDAITGNNDRHTYNWGIVCDLSGKRAPCFSPVYDSARGLFWNEHEQRLGRFKEKQKDGSTNLNKYIQESMPRIGWEGVQDPNHFDLAELIYKNYPNYRYIYDETILPEREIAVNELLEKEFKNLFSATRYFLIKDCLNLRFQNLRNIIDQTKKEERT
ncbi:MAG: HipA domain-containing protein [Saprospiraceae bacterium]|nr:HipA domain-containing protein [Saprospiraceae bacterium]